MLLSADHTPGPLPPAQVTVVTTLESTGRARVPCHEPGARVPAPTRVRCLGDNDVLRLL